jgi:hypothetical protein
MFARAAQSTLDGDGNAVGSGTPTTTTTTPDVVSSSLE